MVRPAPRSSRSAATKCRATTAFDKTGRPREQARQSRTMRRYARRFIAKGGPDDQAPTAPSLDGNVAIYRTRTCDSRTTKTCKTGKEPYINQYRNRAPACASHDHPRDYQTRAISLVNAFLPKALWPNQSRKSDLRYICGRVNRA